MKLKMLTKQNHKVLNQCPHQKCHKDRTSTDTFRLLQEDYKSDPVFYRPGLSKELYKAAQPLYITLPTLSQQISAIEKELGTQLFERSRRKVELTPAGKSFLPHARLNMKEWNQSLQDLKDGAKK